MISSRRSGKSVTKLIGQLKGQVSDYYDFACRRDELYQHSIGLLVGSIKEKHRIKSPEPIIKEVIKTEVVEVVREVEVPKEIEVIKEVEVIKEIEVPKIVIKPDESVVVYYKGLIAELEEKNDLSLAQVNNRYETKLNSLKFSHQAELTNLKLEETKTSQGKLNSLEDLYRRQREGLESKYAKEIKEIVEDYEERLDKKEGLFKKIEKDLVGDIKSGEEKLNSTVSNFKSKLLTSNKNHRKELNELNHKHSNKVKVLHQEQKVTLEEKDTKLKDLKENHDFELETEKTSKKTMERRYKVALLEVKTEHRRQEYIQEGLDKKSLKKHKWMTTYVYLLSIFSLTQILWILIS